MKPFRSFLSALLATLLLVWSCAAVAQWIWLDKDGRKVYSDRSPGAEVPDKSILKRPGGGVTKAVLAAGAEDSAASVVAPGASKPVARSPGAAASAPVLSGKDKELEEKKKQAEAAEKAKAKAEEEKTAKAKAENCERAKKSLATYQSGVRLKQTNSKGEAEYISDADRASETARIKSFVADCQ